MSELSPQNITCGPGSEIVNTNWTPAAQPVVGADEQQEQPR